MDEFFLWIRENISYVLMRIIFALALGKTAFILKFDIVVI